MARTRLNEQLSTSRATGAKPFSFMMPNGGSESVPASPSVTADQRARPRKLAPSAAALRSESLASLEGGVALPPEDAGKRRRRPRKLNRNATPSANAVDADNGAATRSRSAQSGLGTEVEALKTRVQHLEAQIKELYSRPPGKGSPRRRGRRRKGAASGLDTATETETAQGTEIEAEDTELSKLEDDLDRARAELAALTLRARGKNDSITTPADVEDDDVEEIPRTQPPRLQSRRSSRQQVTLSGSYRIPLPENVSLEDVQAIKQGVRSAGLLAKGIYDASRSARHRSVSRAPGHLASVDLAPTPSGDIPGSPRRKWGDWLGGYNMTLTRFVKNMNHHAAFETDNPSFTTAQRRRLARSKSEGSASPTTAAPSSSAQASTGTTPQNPQQESSAAQKSQIPTTAARK